MPNKNFLKILILTMMSWLCALSETLLAALAVPYEGVSLVLGGEDPCAPWARESAQFAVGHLCVVQVSPGDDRPLYVGTVESKVYKFLFNDESIALALPRGDFDTFRKDESWTQQVLRDIPPDQLGIWYSEALYWWRWLKSTESEWSGQEDPA